MLDVIRSKSHSLLIKIAFGIIILVFCFWGVGSFRGGSATEILTVNGESIGVQEMNQKLTQLDDRIRRERPDLTSEDLRKMGIKKQAAQELIFDTLLAQEAKKIGLKVTPVELRRTIEGITDFQKDGKFDPDLYRERLNGSRGETPGSFEKRIAGNLLLYKLQQAITAGSVISEAEAESVFAFGNERRIIEYAFFRSADHLKDAMPNDADISTYYQAHQADFKVPATADVTYLDISASALASKFKPTEDAAKEYYRKNIARFAVPEMIRASHILLLANPNDGEKKVKTVEKEINDIADKLAKGADFAELAKAKSQDPGSAVNGGDLNWFDRSVMVPEFSTAAFALKKDEISKPIRTAYGWHIIKCTGRKDASTQPFADVRDQIDQELGTTEAAGKVQDILDQVLLAVIGGKDLAEAGKDFGLKPVTSGAQSLSELMASMGIKKEDANLLLSTQAGTVRDTPLVTRNGYLVTKVNAVTAESVKTLGDVKDDIIDILKAENSAKLALKAAQKAYAEKDALALVKSDPFTRSSAVPALGNGQEFYREVFGGAKGEWVKQAYAVDNGAVIARIADILPFDRNDWTKFKAQITPALANARLQETYNAFMTILRTSAKVMLKNKDILED